MKVILSSSFKESLSTIIFPNAALQSFSILVSISISLEACSVFVEGSLEVMLTSSSELASSVCFLLAITCF